MANKKITELPAAGALSGTEPVEIVQGGVNKQTTTQDIANLGGGGGSWGSITGTLSSQTDLQSALDAKQATLTAANFGDFLVALTGKTTPVNADVITLSDSAASDDAKKVTLTDFKAFLKTYFDTLYSSGADFTVLSDGATVTWNTASSYVPRAKLTTTQSFTIDMTNVVSGAVGMLKLTMSGAGPFTLTFDTSFTNKYLNTTLTTHTFPAGTALEYYLHWVCEGTTIEWMIVDGARETATPSFVKATRTAAQTISNNTSTAISFDTENYDNCSSWAIGDPTKFYAPSTGDKLATVTVFASFATSSTGIRRVFITKNGSNVAGGVFQESAPSGTVETYLTGSFQVVVPSGEYLGMSVYQNIGGSLNSTASMGVKWEDL